MSGVQRLDPKSQLLLAVSILVGLFFLEYPPIFALGYWSWGAALHKALTGALLVINLVVAQYATRRLSSPGNSTLEGSPGRQGVSET